MELGDGNDHRPNLDSSAVIGLGLQWLALGLALLVGGIGFATGSNGLLGWLGGPPLAFAGALILFYAVRSMRARLAASRGEQQGHGP